MEFVVCIKTWDYSASLELRKNHQVLPDTQANIKWFVWMNQEKITYIQVVILCQLNSQNPSNKLLLPHT